MSSSLIPDKSKMEYRYLGNTGLRVSLFGLGNWINCEDDSQTLDCVKRALLNGINFFDTAEHYGDGIAETTLGKALKELNVPREKIVVTTKLMSVGKDPNDMFLSRKHISEGIKNSLKRLQLEYVDIVYCHRYDMHTPMEEIVTSMNWVIEQGYALYWGTSEWTKIENEYRDLFKRYKLGTTVYSPLFCGVLTGKYIDSMPENCRGNIKNEKNKNKFLNNRYFKNKKEFDEKLIMLKTIAEKYNCTLAQLALGWVVANPDVSCCILGASKGQQIDENVKALEIYKKLGKDDFIEIEKILKNTPPGEIDYLTFKELPSRRNISMNIDYIPKKE